jgi:hypothetical protein
MGFVNDYRTISQLEERAGAAEYSANNAFFMAIDAEEKAKILGDTRQGRSWKRQVKRYQAQAAIANNRGKNLRSLLGRKLKKLKKKG